MKQHVLGYIASAALFIASPRSASAIEIVEVQMRGISIFPSYGGWAGVPDGVEPYLEMSSRFDRDAAPVETGDNYAVYHGFNGSARVYSELDSDDLWVNPYTTTLANATLTIELLERLYGDGGEHPIEGPALLPFFSFQGVTPDGFQFSFGNAGYDQFYDGAVLSFPASFPGGGDYVRWDIAVRDPAGAFIFTSDRTSEPKIVPISSPNPVPDLASTSGLVSLALLLLAGVGRRARTRGGP